MCNCRKYIKSQNAEVKNQKIPRKKKIDIVYDYTVYNKAESSKAIKCPSCGVFFDPNITGCICPNCAIEVNYNGNILIDDIQEI